MNALKTAFKLRYKLINPCKFFLSKDQIKKEYCILNQSSKQTKATLLQKCRLNYDSFVLRFQLQDQQKCLGLKIGQYVQMNYQNESRNYVPISRMDDAGTVDFLIRDMGAKLGQKSFSKKIVQLKENQPVVLKGPKTSYIYNGYGNIQTSQFKKKFKRIGIIAYQTGITSTYALMESLYLYSDNQTSVCLLWIADKFEDFMFIDELGFLNEQSKISMNLMLTKFQKGFPGPYGAISEQHINDFMPPSGQDTLMFLTGTTPQLNHLKSLTNKLGYKYVI